MRLLGAVLISLLVAGCLGSGSPVVKAERVICPPEPITAKPLDFPAFEGKRFGNKGVKKLVREARAAYDSAVVIIRERNNEHEECKLD